MHTFAQYYNILNYSVQTNAMQTNMDLEWISHVRVVSTEITAGEEWNNDAVHT